jgi:hypothetical protein
MSVSDDGGWQLQSSGRFGSNSGSYRAMFDDIHWFLGSHPEVQLQSVECTTRPLRFLLSPHCQNNTIDRTPTSSHDHSMPKPEIQPLIPLILGRVQINPPLLHAHRTPDLLPGLIPPNIIPLRKKEQRQSEDTNRNQHAITAVIQRLVVFAVDIRSYDSAELDTHVVAGG